MAASAGNHAQGVALACALLGIQANILMPKFTPLFFGSEKVRIYLLGENYDEAFFASRKFCETNGAIYISPLNRFVAGALSVAGLAEMAEEIKGKTVVCVISGGNFDPKCFPEIKLLTSA